MQVTETLKPVSDRQKSGYKRDFNPLDVFFFNVMGFALGLALSINPSFIGGFAPSSNILLVIILGGVLGLCNGLIYGWFGAIMPNTGGDFVFVSRSINHRLGFLTSWGFSFCQIYGMAMNIGWIITMGIAPSLITIGYSFDKPELIQFAGNLSNHYIIVGSLLILLFYWLISILGFTLTRWVAIILFLIGMLGPILMTVILINTSHADYVSGFNAFMFKTNKSKDAFLQLISSAKGLGMVVSTNPGSVFYDSLKALPIGFLCYLGFTYSVYVGGEVAKPEKSQMKGILWALFLGVTSFAICMSLYANRVGQEFHAAVGNPDAIQKIGLPANSLNFLLGIVAKDPWENLLMQTGNLIWFILVPYVMLQVCVRNVMAWTLDGLLPVIFLKRSKGPNQPWIVNTLICIIALVFIIINSFWGISLVGAVALAAVAYLFTSLAALVLQTTNPDAYAKLPLSARKKFLGIDSNFKVIGFICVIAFVWVIYASIFFPEISGGSTYRAIFMVLGIYILGLIFYQVQRNKLKKKSENANVNWDELFKEIPED